MIKYGQLLSKRVAKVSCSRKILTRREVKGLIDGGPDSPCDAMWETSHFYAIKYHELVSTREKPYASQKRSLWAIASDGAGGGPFDN
jgi:hypothetical protein